ncbi:MAG: hypothetical protein AAGG69_10455 [Pseudomonadota bacterium]
MLKAIGRHSRSAAVIIAIGAAILLAAGEQARANSFQGCGWYVIMGCSVSYSSTRELAGNGFLTIDTNDYPNFRDGWFCVAEGPYSRRSDANRFMTSIKSDVPDAYVKNGC